MADRIFQDGFTFQDGFISQIRFVTGNHEPDQQIEKDIDEAITKEMRLVMNQQQRSAAARRRRVPINLQFDSFQTQ